MLFMRPGAVESGQRPLQQRIFMISVLLSRREGRTQSFALAAPVGICLLNNRTMPQGDWRAASTLCCRAAVPLHV